MKKGDMVLKILEAGKFRDLPIKEGEVISFKLIYIIPITAHGGI